MRVAAADLSRRVFETLQLIHDVLDHAELLRQLLLGTHPLLPQVRIVERTEMLLDLCDDAIKVYEPAHRCGREGRTRRQNAACTSNCNALHVYGNVPVRDKAAAQGRSVGTYEAS